MKRFISIFFSLALLFSLRVEAATFNVTTASGGGGVPACAADPANPKVACNLQEALAVAATNNEDDLINLAAGSGGNYLTSNNGGSRFVYDSVQDNDLILAGAGIGSTILDGNNVSEVLDIRTTGTNAVIQINGITIQNAADSGAGIAGGLFITNANGNIDIDGCELLNNKHDGTAAGLSITSGGDLTITNSLFSNNAFETVGASGGAIFLTVGGNVAIHKNILTGNKGGVSAGGLYVSCGGNFNLSENTFSENTSEASNSAVFASVGVDLFLDNNTFSKNNGASGIGTFVTGRLANFSHNTFDQNRATSGNQMLATVGSDLGFDNNVFTMNLAKHTGVALLSVVGNSTFNQNTFSGNTSESNVGGMQLTTGGNLIFNNGTLLNNTGLLNGGGYFNTGGTLTMVNNIIAGNTSTDTNAVDGAGVKISTGGSMNIVNNTVFANTLSGAAGRGGGLFIAPQGMEANIYNNIVFGNIIPGLGNGEDLFVDYSSFPSVDLNLFNNDFNEACFDDGVNPVNCDPQTVVGLNHAGNITNPGLDPVFIDAGAGDFRLGAGSPAIDAGDANAPNLPATDHDGNPRIVGGQVDMGALEAQPDIGVNPTSFSFGAVQVGGDVSQILTISNDGSVPMNVTGMVLSDDANYSLDLTAGADPCGLLNFTLEAGESCTIGITFGPSDTGAFDATLTILSNDPDEPEVLVTLTGMGIRQTFEFRGGGCGISSGSPPPMQSLVLILIPIVVGVVRCRWSRGWE